MKHFVVFFILVASLNIQRAFAQYSAVSTAQLDVSFSPQDYVSQYVKPRVEAWQKRGRYESSVDYLQRVTEAKRSAYIEQLSIQAQDNLKKIIERSLIWSEFKISDYDPDNQTFIIHTLRFGDFLLPVPTKEASDFEKSFTSVTKSSPDFYFTENGNIRISRLTFSAPNGKQYIYRSTDPARFAKVNVNVNFGEISTEVQYGEDKKPNIVKGNDITVGKSDVDVHIPLTTSQNKNTFAVILSNENYQNEQKVDYAQNDGATFKEYCQKTLGLPLNNIHFKVDATFNNMRAELNWIKQVAEVYHDATFISYYDGHGVPDEATKEAYLLPVDAVSSDLSTGFSLSQLYTDLGKIKAKNIYCFWDACFSGSRRGEGMLAANRGVAIKPHLGSPQGNTIVFSAASDQETAYPYREKGHGLFSYFLLKKLQESNGHATIGDLSDYVISQVKQQSIVVNNKSQTPSINTSAALSESWRTLTLFQ